MYTYICINKHIYIHIPSGRSHPTVCPCLYTYILIDSFIESYACILYIFINSPAPSGTPLVIHQFVPDYCAQTVYVCKCDYLYICSYTCIYMHMCICIYLYIHICIYTPMGWLQQVDEYTCVYAHSHVYMNIHMCMHIRR